jgi:hypothetical protein
MNGCVLPLILVLACAELTADGMSCRRTAGARLAGGHEDAGPGKSVTK